MQDIHGIRPPVPVGFDPGLLKIILMVLGGLFVLLLAFFLIRKWLKKRNQPDPRLLLPEPLPPFDAALKALELLSQKQIQDPRLFYFDLTAIFRHYIGQTFKIHATEMTSQEFIQRVNRLDLDKGIKKEIAGFQKFSDPIKYAGTVPEKDQVKKDLVFIKEKIKRIETDLKNHEKNEQGDE